jgi:hypothetical protein
MLSCLEKIDEVPSRVIESNNTRSTLGGKMTDAEDTAWARKATAKRAALLDSIPSAFRIPANIIPPETQLDVSRFPAESKWFTPEELEIISTSAPALLEKIASKAWSAQDVTKAFCKSAAAAHQLVGLGVYDSADFGVY